MIRKIVFWTVLVFFLLALPSFADIDTGSSCDLDCSSLSQNGDSYYCNSETQTCFLVESIAVANATIPATPTVSTADGKITVLEGKVAVLETELATLSSDLTLTKSEIITIQNQISKLQGELATLQSKDQDLSSKTTSLSTGLAGLQQTLDSLQETLSERESFSRIITFTLVILIIVGVAGGLYYYINRKQNAISPEIINYINNNIKLGKKLPHIKQELRKAGWTDSDIEKAYHQTVKQNYRQYKSAQPSTTASVQSQAERRSSANNSEDRSASNFPYDPKKMIIIAVVSILVIIGAIFVLRAATGEAIFFKKLIGGQENGTSGENTYTIECTPPHLLNPSGDACCLDSDGSGVCDTTELQGAGLAAGGDCSDSRECKAGLYCISNKCSSLDSLYSGEGDCSKLCSYYAIKVLTSDGEKYDLKPKQGSYTGAGALEWKILPMPQHCKGESPIVPINVITKQTGEIVSEEVILLHEGEQSSVLTHPTVSKLAFTLTVADVFESCPE